MVFLHGGCDQYRMVIRGKDYVFWLSYIVTCCTFCTFNKYDNELSNCCWLLAWEFRKEKNNEYFLRRTPSEDGPILLLNTCILLNEISGIGTVQQKKCDHQNLTNFHRPHTHTELTKLLFEMCSVWYDYVAVGGTTSNYQLWIKFSLYFLRYS